MNVVLFHADVANDLNEASRWYERRKPRLGRTFRDAFDETLGRVVDSPLRFTPVEENMRCARLKKFPYGIFYEHVRESVVVVYGVLHHSRDPKLWRSRRSGPPP